MSLFNPDKDFSVSSPEETLEKLRKALEQGSSSGGRRRKLIPESLDPGLVLIIYEKDENGKITSRGATHKELAEHHKNCIDCVDENGNGPLIHKDYVEEWLNGHPDRRIFKLAEEKWQRLKS